MGFGTLGALLGAAAGTFLAFVTVCARALAIDLDTAPHVIVIGALLVGSFATLGFELCSDQ
jgi:drug/metabolite transporter (DMT)-like permease